MFSGKWPVVLLINHFLCAGPADEWLHYPAFKGRGESGSGHEKDPFCILIEVQKKW